MSSFREVLKSRKFLTVAHRGASAHAPENTLPAFDLACGQGADVIELDVHLTRDDEVVVMHDERVDRTTDGRGEIRSMALAEIRAMDAGTWFGPQFRGVRVPTLADVLERFLGRVLIDIELKGVTEDATASTHLARSVLAVVERSAAGDRVVVSSAGARALTWVHATAAQVATQWSVFTLDIAREAAFAAGAGFDVLSPQDYAATEANIARAHEHDLAVHIYTGGDDAQMARLIEVGADAVKTGRPDLLRAVAARLGRA